jgi:uncharacterized protein YacL
MINRLIRVAIVLSVGLCGGYISTFLLDHNMIPLTYINILPYKKISVIIGFGIIFGFIGILIAPGLAKWIIKTALWLEQKLSRMPIQDIFGGAVGLIVGLIIAVLLGSAIEVIPVIGGILKIAVVLLFGFLGLSVGIKKKEDLLGLLTSLPRFGKDKANKQDPKSNIKALKILDTSVIIDGRIADICKSGFIEGTLIIPSFVLEELRHIADSSDLLKRNRGRRGLDILNKIRKELDVMVQIYELDFEDIAEVDSKLVKLGQVIDGIILTNDYNLNKVAELQGVKVLNINELANAVKPVVLPGEEMVVQVIKDGKESGQGLAYLDDGTMIVVDNGRKYIGQTIAVIVTSVLQTSAGRMIFAKAKLAENKKMIESSVPASFDEVNILG